MWPAQAARPHLPLVRGSANCGLGPLERLSGPLLPDARRERAKQTQSLLGRQAKPAVVRKLHAREATRPVDVKAYLGRADSLKLAPQPLSPLCRVMHGPAR